MKLLALKILRGPNFWSIRRHHLIQMTLDLEELEQKPTNKIPHFYERLQKALPSLHEHRCSEGVPGGFFRRVREGTWMGHVIEHIALELQTLAGLSTGFGRTRSTGKEGVYQVVFSYEEEEAGIYAGKAAVRIAECLVNGENPDIKNDVHSIRELWLQHKLGPSTGAIVEEAKKRGIPYLRLDKGSYVQLGYGSRQKRIQATIASTTASIGVDAAGDKNETKLLLTEAGVPVPQGGVAETVENLKAIIETTGFPLVGKPLDGNHGRGVTIQIETYEEAVAAFHRAKNISEKVVFERFVEGKDFRILLVNYKMVAAALRTPAAVTGDGKHTIGQLIEKVNADPRRGNNHNNVLTRIEIDEATIDFIKKKNYTLASVLPKGEQLLLKPTANLSTGGTATDVTDEVHPFNQFLFERAARAIGLDICGLDVMAPDLKTPITENGGAVLEINAAPGFRMHLYPSEGRARNVAKPVIDLLFPGKDKGRIPIIAITGTNGKTTTTRLAAFMSRMAGFTTGYTTTDGIYINEHQLEAGDCSGPGSAQKVLKDSSVEFAVLETARGGILRSGLGFDKCDCAIITNVAEDHLGLEEIHTLEKLARVKAVVAESVTENGFAVLNADDDLVYALKDELKCKVALFSLYANNIRIERHCEQGGLVAVYEDGFLLIKQGNRIFPLEEAVKIPITFSGRAPFNIMNALAASLAAYACTISLKAIRQALRSFVPSVETTPGRVNLMEFSGFRVMLDYAHNQHGVKALGSLIKTMEASVKVGVITGVGDRRDEDIIALGEESARIFDQIIIRHDNDLRGRDRAELDRLLVTGIRNIHPSKPITILSDEQEAAEFAIANAQPDSLIVLLVDQVKAIAAFIQKLQKMDSIRASSFQKAG